MMSAIYLSLFLCVLPSAISKTYCHKENNATLNCNYFPNELPEKVSRVIIQNFRKVDENLVVNGSFFATKNWRFVKYLEISDESVVSGTLTLDAGCFSQLKVLVELHLHLALADFILSADAFVGANSVRVLNVSSCVRLDMQDFLASLNGTNKLRNLKVLAISRLSHYRGPLVVDLIFGNILQTKRVTEIEIIGSEISYLRLSIFGCVKSLEKFNVSQSQLSHTDDKGFNISDLSSLKVMDLSYLELPKTGMPPPGKLVLSNEYFTDERIIRVLSGILTPISVNGTSIFPKTTHIWIINCTLPINKPLHIHGRELVIKQNNLRHFDLRCTNNSISSIEVVDFSENGLQFFTPFAATCLPQIKMLDFTNNQLFIMEKQNISLFAKLAGSFSYLQFISFSENNLQTIPYNMFSNNSALEFIDLSSNKLQQVTFSLEHLCKLKTLDLRNNLIHILNDLSIDRLNSIPDSSYHKKKNATVILASNSISCSTCNAKHFIQWILTTNYVNITSQNLKCLDNDGRKTEISEKTVQHLKHLCNLLLYIISSCSSAILFILIIVAFVYKLYKRRFLIRQREHRYNVIERLRVGLHQYKYACYLVYSLEDSGNEECDSEQRYMIDSEHFMNREFVENYFIAPLKRNLQHEIGAERQLVCCDEDSDGGRSDFDVFFNNLASSSSVVVIASEKFFSNALYCWMLEQVIAQEKQIIFLIEDGIAHKLRKEETKRIFKNCKKFKWKIENGELILKTSWNEVCLAIFDGTCLSENDN
ncbi:toll-like receptor 4 [Ruditapes philippinarum]|uniref:toll-like receptor 4 n=1 Tax=Ruditapes philippinarum TaxID=129788 RepID=UPI00295B4D00|nr:toll-like receptor 4 [Ruditapes philippinarum]